MIKKMLEWILGKLGALWRRHERARLGSVPKTDDSLKVIIVTTVTMPGSMLMFRYQGKRHALIHPEDWEKVKASIANRPATMPVSPLYGIPVVHDDELARQVLSGAIVEGRQKNWKEQKDARWN